MKVVVSAFNQEKALVEAFLRDYALRMELFEALISSLQPGAGLNYHLPAEV